MINLKKAFFSFFILAAFAGSFSFADEKVLSENNTSTEIAAEGSRHGLWYGRPYHYRPYYYYYPYYYRYYYHSPYRHYYAEGW